ncbi:MAG: hypothetical protein K9M45_09195 [Kiritimatiellales bacterium]|nr:hypothetical protein [Kiritimatiellales bacterium]
MKKLTLVVLLVSAVAQAENILIEAENFTGTQTKLKEFATPRRESGASSGKILYRIFTGGTVHYSFNAEASGEYTGWIRYTRKQGKPVQCEVNGKNFKSDSPGTGTTPSGKEAWGWMKLFSAKLPKAGNELVLQPSAWRIDCIVISPDPDFVPDDRFIRENQSLKLSAEQWELMRRQIVPVVPDFLRDAPDYELPEWFDGHRVHLHTRLSLNMHRRQPELFFSPAKHFKEMGVKVYTRHIKTAGEGAWWPSKTGAVHELAKNRNIAKEIIDDAHKHGLKIIAYNRHMEDDYMAELHPDWRCVDSEGEPLHTKRGIIMCMNSPYADWFVNRQLELVELGVDGFYYDEVHMPRDACWCPYCRKAFKELTGLNHPEEKNADDPLWHKLKEFNNYTIAKTFAHWRGVLHAKRPDLVMVISSNLWPSLSDKHMNSYVFPIADCHKTEFNKGLVYKGPQMLWQFPDSFRPMADDVRLGLGYDVARDAADGRPAHVWAHRIRYESHMLAATAGMVAHGCIANLDVQEKNIPDANFKSSFEMGDRVSPYLAGTKPLRHVAILHSEQTRDRMGPDSYKVWENLLYPLYGAYHTLVRDHIPCGFIFDSQLAMQKFDNINILFVPEIGTLSDELKTALAEFKKSGGTVIENNPDWQWHTEEGWPAAQAAFRQAIAPAKVPAQAVGGNEKMQLQAFTSKDGKKLTVCLANDFSWAQVGGKGEEGYVEGDTQASVKEKPPACSGVILKLARKPKCVFEANTGKELKWTANGIKIPAFEYLAVVVAEY